MLPVAVVVSVGFFRLSEFLLLGLLLGTLKLAASLTRFFPPRVQRPLRVLHAAQARALQ